MPSKFALAIGGKKESVEKAKKIIEEEFVDEDSTVEYEKDKDKCSELDIIFRANQNGTIFEECCGCKEVMQRIMYVHPEFGKSIDFYCYTCFNRYSFVCDNCNVKNCDGYCRK